MLVQNRRRGPTLDQHWFNVLCIHGVHKMYSRVNNEAVKWCMRPNIFVMNEVIPLLHVVYDTN